MARRPSYRPTDEEKKALTEVKECIAEGMRWHRPFAQRVEKRYDAYRGLVAGGDAPKTWRSNLHPPYLINIVEGMLSSMEEATPNWKVTPRALPGMKLQDVIDQSERAEIAGYTLAHQMRLDDFAGKQSPFMQQDLIAGFTPGKTFWLREESTRRYLDETPQMIFDEGGGTIDMAMALEEWEGDIVLRDDPTFEVRDVRDFLFPESATSLQTAPWVLDRTFVHYSTLERLEQLGVYKNVNFVKETRKDESNRGPDVVGDREQRLRNADRTRGLVELVELWSGNRVITVANRTVVLRDVDNPFNHREKPFVICSAIPDAFQIPGISVIEGLAQMQEMLWTLMNTRMDTTRMAANLITLIRGDVDNSDDYEWAPEAQWIVPDAQAVSTLDVNPTISTITLQAEALLKGDIQNVMGGLPFTGGGAQSQTVDQSTATGVSIVTNIAQQILARRKGMYLRCFAKLGKQFLALDQQFMREERLVEILGEGGAKRWMEVNPMQVQGIFDVELEMVGDSMMRQEKRAESGALLTQAMQSAGVMAQMGTPLNLRRFWEKHLQAYDVADKMTFFAEPKSAPPALAAGPPSTGTPPSAGSIQDGMSGSMDAGGITNESLAAGTTAPSSSVSMSGAAPMQRALALNGAGRSV